MKRSRLWIAVPVALAAVLGLAVACGSSPQQERAKVQQVRQALGAEGLDFYLSVQSVTNVGTPTWTSAGIFYNPNCETGDGGGAGGSGAVGGAGGGDDGGSTPPCDPGSGVSDVTLTTTVTGNFNTSNFSYYGPAGFSCSQTVVSAGVTVTCHADSFAPFSNGGFGMYVVPNTRDVITTTATLTAGGVEVRAETRQTTIADPGADLAVWSGGGGKVLVGQQAYTSFLLGNYGPLTATNPKLELTLSGPGAFNYLSVNTGVCTWTQTTAVCRASTFPRYVGVPVSVGFVGNAEGRVTINAVISSDTSDPNPGNNGATSYFDVIRPKVADLAISMTDSPDPAKVGRPLSYGIRVTNNGPDTASYPVVTDYLPYNTTFVSATPTQGSCWGGEWGYLTCDLGPLAAAQSATIDVVITPLEGGTISNYAQVYNTEPYATDPDLSNNSALVETTVKGPNPPVTVTSSSDRFFTAMGAYVDCANDFVLLEGFLHVSYHTIYNERSGFFMITQLSNPQGMTGVGFNTGDAYHATGMTRYAQRFTGGFPDSFTFENNFRIIGDKTGNNLLVHETTLVTFNPDGSLKTEVSKYSFECK